jgi:hypothetical protein
LAAGALDVDDFALADGDFDGVALLPPDDPLGDCDGGLELGDVDDGGVDDGGVDDGGVDDGGVDDGGVEDGGVDEGGVDPGGAEVVGGADGFATAGSGRAAP